MPVKLYSRIVGTGPPLIILHGVFGSGDNWATFLRPLAERYTLHMLDLRNHGRSPHAAPMTYQAMAEDVAQYAQTHFDGNPAGIIGHSLGGKLALFLAWLMPSLVERVCVVDIAPREYKPHHQPQIAGMRAVDPPSLTTRHEAEERMSPHITEPDVRAFLLKNLARTETGGFTWKLNLDLMAQSMEFVGEGLPSQAVVTQPLTFIRGGASRYISEEDIAYIELHFPQARIVTIPNAGHWIQVDQPDLLMAELTTWLA
jgi:esterase